MEKPLVNPLEQFLLLAKSAKGVAAVELIKQVLETPGVYTFGELLDMPSISDLKNGQHSNYYDLLRLFAFGTCQDYKAKKATLPPLSPAQQKKLRHLTIVSLATKNKCLPYTLLLTELEVSNLRELEITALDELLASALAAEALSVKLSELRKLQNVITTVIQTDLIIEVIYADIIRGKLDQKKQQLEVDYAIGRDIQPQYIPHLATVLREWCVGCEALLSTIETEVKKANEQKETHIERVKKMEQEVINVKKTLKATQQHEMEEQMAMDISSRDMASSSDKQRKMAKTKGGLRGSNANSRPSK